MSRPLLQVREVQTADSKGAVLKYLCRLFQIPVSIGQWKLFQSKRFFDNDLNSVTGYFPG